MYTFISISEYIALRFNLISQFVIAAKWHLKIYFKLRNMFLLLQWCVKYLFEFMYVIYAEGTSILCSFWTWCVFCNYIVKFTLNGVRSDMAQAEAKFISIDRKNLRKFFLFCILSLCILHYPLQQCFRKCLESWKWKWKKLPLNISS